MKKKSTRSDRVCVGGESHPCLARAHTQTNKQTHTHDSDVLFDGNVNDDITSAGGSVACLDTSYTTGLLACSGCTGSYVIPLACMLCSPASVNSCSVCPQGTYGGAEAEIACQLCAVGFTTIFPPSSTSPGDCVAITQPPTQVREVDG